MVRNFTGALQTEILKQWFRLHFVEIFSRFICDSFIGESGGARDLSVRHLQTLKQSVGS